MEREKARAKRRRRSEREFGAKDANRPTKSSTKKFDPEGSGYDYESAKKAGLKPDKTGHWPSRDPKTGLLLKGRGHETFAKTIAGEEAAGHEVYKGKDGRYYSRPKKKDKWDNYSENKDNAFKGAGIPNVFMQDLPKQGGGWSGRPGTYNARR